MIQETITKIRNNSVILPKTWKGSRVFLRVTGNTATITKLKKYKPNFFTGRGAGFKKAW